MISVSSRMKYQDIILDKWLQNYKKACCDWNISPWRFKRIPKIGMKFRNLLAVTWWKYILIIIFLVHNSIQIFFLIYNFLLSVVINRFKANDFFCICKRFREINFRFDINNAILESLFLLITDQFASKQLTLCINTLDFQEVKYFLNY